jgi:acetyltransferase
MTRDPTAASSTRWLESYPAHLSRTWILPSGRSLRVRPIRHDDDGLEAAFVRGLSTESGYQRMLSGAIKVTPEWIESLTHVDYRRHMAFVVVNEADGREQFVGVGRYVADASTGIAEFALVIADAWHGQGLGRRLLELLLEHGKDSGVRGLEGIVLAVNRPMLHLASSLGFSLKTDPEDATIVRIRRTLSASAQPH